MCFMLGKRQNYFTAKLIVYIFHVVSLLLWSIRVWHNVLLLTAIK